VAVVAIGDRTLVWRPADARARHPVAEATRRVRVDLVAAGHARDLLAGEQQEVKGRRREADQALDPAPPGALRGAEVRHGARL
jgi:hypothetical protein